MRVSLHKRLSVNYQQTRQCADTLQVQQMKTVNASFNVYKATYCYTIQKTTAAQC